MEPPDTGLPIPQALPAAAAAGRPGTSPTPAPGPYEPRLQRAAVASNPLTAAAIAAIHRGGGAARRLVNGWVGDGDGNPVFRHLGRHGGRILVYPDPIRAGDAPPPAPVALWQFVESLNPLTADVALALLAQIHEAGRMGAGDGPTWITADAIATYLGSRARGAARAALATRIAAEMARLRTLAFSVEDYAVFDPATRRWTPTGVSWSGDRLFDIVAVRAEGAETPRAWLVRAGQWAHWWFNPNGRMWLSRLSAAVLALDHRANRGAEAMAKKIGQHFVLHQAAIRDGRVPDRPTVERYVDRLLADIGELPPPEHRPAHWAARTRTRFERALARLVAIGLFAEVSWPDGGGPADRDRARGWVEHWLGDKVRIVLDDHSKQPGAKPRPRARTGRVRTAETAAPVARDTTTASGTRRRVAH